MEPQQDPRLNPGPDEDKAELQEAKQDRPYACSFGLLSIASFSITVRSDSSSSGKVRMGVSEQVHSGSNSGSNVTESAGTLPPAALVVGSKASGLAQTVCSRRFCRKECMSLQSCWGLLVSAAVTRNWRVFSLRKGRALVVSHKEGFGGGRGGGGVSITKQNKSIQAHYGHRRRSVLDPNRCGVSRLRRGRGKVKRYSGFFFSGVGILKTPCHTEHFEYPPNVGV